jgi:hypothetical protein
MFPYLSKYGPAGKRKFGRLPAGPCRLGLGPGGGIARGATGRIREGEVDMDLRLYPVLLLLLATAALSTACASGDQWAEWRNHSSHFASGDHMRFSLRHQGKDPTPRVTAGDVQKAGFQSWWGEPIVVRPDQIFAG